MSIRTRASSLLAARLGRDYSSRLDRGTVWSIPGIGRRTLSEGIRRWLRYRIFEPAEEYARSILDRDQTLGALPWPAPNWYSLSPISRIVFHGLLESMAPCRIVELGSGVSTLISAAYAVRRGLATNGPVVWSIDHDAGWLEETRRLLDRAGLSYSVRLIHAPLEEREINGVQTVTYAIPSSALAEATGPHGFDVCLIDGPPRTFGRRGCLPVLASYLSEGATILLDDSLRSGEQEAWREWLRTYRGCLSKTRLMLTDRGMLMGRWRCRPG